MHEVIKFPGSRMIPASGGKEIKCNSSLRWRQMLSCKCMAKKEPTKLRLADEKEQLTLQKFGGRHCNYIQMREVGRSLRLWLGDGCYI